MLQPSPVLDSFQKANIACIKTQLWSYGKLLLQRGHFFLWDLPKHSLVMAGLGPTALFFHPLS